MKIYKVLVLVLINYQGICCEGKPQPQLLSGQFHYERGEGTGSRLLPVFSRVLSSTAQRVAGGLHNILNTARDTVQKLTSPVSLEFNAQLGYNQANGNRNITPNSQQHEYQTHKLDHSNENTHSTNNYVIPNENTDGINEPSPNFGNLMVKNKQNNKGDVIMYIDGKFPVILLNENEIRR